MFEHLPTGLSFLFPYGGPFKAKGDLRNAVKLLAVIVAVLCWGCLYRRQIDAAASPACF
jgi:hypothetical protein